MPSAPYHSGLPENDPSVPDWVRESARPDRPERARAERLGVPIERLEGGVARFEPFAAPSLPASPGLGQDADAFWVHLRTDQWAPNHQVTIRNEQDGWDRDVYGKYRFGAWHFRFEKAVYPQGLRLRFVLNGHVPMQGADLVLPSSADHDLTGAQVAFQADPAGRFRHGIDDFVCYASPREEETVPYNTDPSQQYDVIVIGSGMGGGVLADELSDLGRRVLVLEAGGLELPSHIDNVPGDRSRMPLLYQSLNFENGPGSGFLFGVQFALGGRSLFWSGLIPRIYEWELAHWPAPVAAHLGSANGYARAERLVRLSKVGGPFQQSVVTRLSQNVPDFHVRDLPRSRDQARTGPGGAPLDVPDEDVGTFSTADLLLGSLAYKGPSGSANLTINLHHLVTRLITAGNKVTGVTCQDLAGNRERTYCAKHVVLAAGSVQSPKIALDSGLADPTGKIGRGLTDHPAYFSAEYEVPEGLFLDAPQKHAKVLLSPKNAPDQHPYHVEFLVNPWHWNTRFTDPDLRRQEVGGKNRATVKMTFTFDAPLNDANHIRGNGPGRKATVVVAPNPRGQGFAGETKHVRNRLLEAVGMRELSPNQDMGYGNQGTPHHAGGSLRMAGDASGVVDADLKFLAYDNLYCCDVSVYPRIPIANPALTLVALAQRLADHLHTRL
ncbi:MAG TPA: GMC family oxidoreductase [Tepidisphaeraceae bacterium]|nr:GMC family oxidoreductase [Tepidisphaeraceae bacterium]